MARGMPHCPMRYVPRHATHSAGDGDGCGLFWSISIGSIDPLDLHTPRPIIRKQKYGGQFAFQINITHDCTTMQFPMLDETSLVCAHTCVHTYVRACIHAHMLQT